jgi:hypothetical protein
MAKQPKVYEIKTLPDMLAIPIDRVDVFLVEFGEALKSALAVKAVADALSMGLGKEPEFGFTGMKWTDDGKDDVKVRVQITPKK